MYIMGENSREDRMKTVKMNDLMVVIFSNKDLGVKYLYDTLETLYSELKEHKLYIFDLSEIRHLSDEALGSLTFLQGYMKDRKKSLRMYQTRDKLSSVYREMNLDKVMSMAYGTSNDLNDDENVVFYIR